MSQLIDLFTDANIEMARNLVLMAIPAHVVYLFVTVIVKENTVLTVPFLLLYVFAAVVQVSSPKSKE